MTAPQRTTAGSPGERRARIVSPAHLPGPSGGTIYNERIAEQWGIDIEWRPGRWPFPSGADLDRLRHALMPSGARRPVPVLLDGLIACAAPEVMREARAVGARVVVVVHLPLPAETGLTPQQIDQLTASEAAALSRASAVVVTSRWAAADLHARYGLEGVTVAEPGAEKSPLAGGSIPPRFVTVAAYSPRKNHRLLIQALRHPLLKDLEWSALWVGADPSGDAHMATSRAVAAAGLQTRIRVQRPLIGADLTAAWAGADLLLLPSRAETYAMVVAEALACGIPALVGAGTGAAETLRGTEDPGRMPGLALPTDDTDAWAKAIRKWLISPPQRQAWSDAAQHRRSQVNSWKRSADIITQVMDNRHEKGA